MAKAMQLIALFFIILGFLFAIANVAAAIALGMAGMIALASSYLFDPLRRSQMPKRVQSRQTTRRSSKSARRSRP
ncbi:hypothetical protein Pse7367_1950 [Thalassoporum mexicanum PCC 7367]|uniref:hypothetical protein n=1 Tax=Thalassoporum mexicanum TaxID=3457544 RepID=UPI00029FEB85|nr:hypothetical protein [Pseudanabaena sp. PCC 7367]AFY70225.1 hypothetical protein Pse7367_1950 [Pseudanabaena sp. PCC 7367]